MKIVDRWEDLVHTHFVTDAVRLTAERMRELERDFVPLLRAAGVVFGSLRTRASRSGQVELARIIAPIPIWPPTVTGVRTVER